MTDTEGIVIAKDEIKDALREKLDRDPTKEELNLFREFCVVDIGDWLSDNAKSFVTNESE
ncbi:MAG: hypothetical protein JRN20_13720 [Nitrososphaerota archaeon]|nr:hypothetical protein [Nitrososphaerota archaeon]